MSHTSSGTGWAAAAGGSGAAAGSALAHGSAAARRLELSRSVKAASEASRPSSRAARLHRARASTLRAGAIGPDRAPMSVPVAALADQRRRWGERKLGGRVVSSIWGIGTALQRCAAPGPNSSHPHPCRAHNPQRSGESKVRCCRVVPRAANRLAASTPRHPVPEHGSAQRRRSGSSRAGAAATSKRTWRRRRLSVPGRPLCTMRR